MKKHRVLARSASFKKFNTLTTFSITGSFFYQGQGEYSSKPLRRSIKRILVFKRLIWAHFYPLKSSDPKIIGIKSYLFKNFSQKKAPENSRWPFKVKNPFKKGNDIIFWMFENPRRGRQARHFTKNVPKILDIKSSSEQIFSESWRWVPLFYWDSDLWLCFLLQCTSSELQ